eukprot:TRINITY_DN2828_c0_g1_i1.p1 TRINITY_DN2828_c0_g1~~TRINITY_DN2828_c0_g1_i1.p1  ORF type:complete len:331 (+),score=41.99 TRINITY_DN2828_c0_g1_i1:415-1407(+)
MILGNEIYDNAAWLLVALSVFVLIVCSMLLNKKLTPNPSIWLVKFVCVCGQCFMLKYFSKDDKNPGEDDKNLGQDNTEFSMSEGVSMSGEVSTSGEDNSIYYWVCSIWMGLIVLFYATILMSLWRKKKWRVDFCWNDLFHMVFAIIFELLGFLLQLVSDDLDGNMARIICGMLILYMVAYNLWIDPKLNETQDTTKKSCPLLRDEITDWKEFGWDVIYVVFSTLVTTGCFYLAKHKIEGLHFHVILLLLLVASILGYFVKQTISEDWKKYSRLYRFCVFAAIIVVRYFTALALFILMKSDHNYANFFVSVSPLLVFVVGTYVVKKLENSG